MKRYLVILLGTAGVAALAFFGAELQLTPALVRGEYWVRQLLVAKHDLAQSWRGRGRKIVVAGGSSVMFGVDTKQLGEELRVPALNLGLHAGLPLETILEEAEGACERGDTLVLALEPPYYSVTGHLSAWQARNMMAWQPEKWKELSLAERVRGLGALGPAFLPELMEARDNAKHPKWLRKRLAALDDAETLRKCRVHVPPTSFSYAPEHLDALGNIRLNDAPGYGKEPTPADKEIAVSAESWRLLSEFTGRMGKKGVTVYLANTPWVDNGRLDLAKVERASRVLTSRLAALAPWLDERAEVIFPREDFFDTELHLTSAGRKVRTHRLAEAMIAHGAAERPAGG